MHDPIAAVLAFAVASYEVSDLSSEQSGTTEANNSQVSASSVVRRAKANQVKKEGKTVASPAGSVKLEAPPTDEPLPSAGSISAEQFLRQLSSCGMRPNSHGVLVYQTAEIQRRDERRLVAAFLGWDSRLHHGFQLDNARWHAARLLNPLPGKNYRRGTMPIHPAWVAGSPDMVFKKVQDLLSREKIAAETICSHEKMVAKARSDQEKNLFIGMIALEEARIEAIRRDLESFGALDKQLLDPPTIEKMAEEEVFA